MGSKVVRKVFRKKVFRKFAVAVCGFILFPIGTYAEYEPMSLAKSKLTPAQQVQMEENMIHRALISLLYDENYLESTDWICTDDECREKNKKRVRHNLIRLYDRVDIAAGACEQDYEELQFRSVGYEGGTDDLSEEDFVLISDHRDFKRTNTLLEHLGKIGDLRTGAYKDVSNKIETHMMRRGKVMVSCEAVVQAARPTKFETLSEEESKAKAGQMCQRYERLRSCLVDYTNTAQFIYDARTNYVANKGLSKDLLTEPYPYFEINRP